MSSAVEIWKQIISVQMHFNDIEMRTRNLYVTVLLRTAAAVGWVLDKKLKLELSRARQRRRDTGYPKGLKPRRRVLRSGWDYAYSG
jgi:hypothetical protein